MRDSKLAQCLGCKRFYFTFFAEHGWVICNRRLVYLALRRKGLIIDLQRVLTSAEVLFFAPENSTITSGEVLKHDLIYHRKGIPVNTILLLPSAHSIADARHNTLFSTLNIPFCFAQTRKYNLILDKFSLSSLQLVPN